MHKCQLPALQLLREFAPCFGLHLRVEMVAEHADEAGLLPQGLASAVLCSKADGTAPQLWCVVVESPLRLEERQHRCCVVLRDLAGIVEQGGCPPPGAPVWRVHGMRRRLPGARNH